MVEGAFAFGELLKLIVALGVTIGLFYALALFMKRMQVGTGRGGNLITVLAALPLGGKEKLWVVEVAGEKLVVGTSPGSVSCLHVLQGSIDANSSFPRRRESSDAVQDLSEAALDSRLRGNDEVETSANHASKTTPQNAFATLLQNFRGGEKS